MNIKKTLTSSTTLAGTLMGAGILAIPYTFSRSGFIVGLFWTIFLGFIMILSYLYLGEVLLRTKNNHQLPGLAEKYLGKKGKFLMLFTMIFAIYASLIVYLIGEGESLSMLFFGNLDYSLYFSIGFWIILTLLLEGGIERLKKIETIGVIIIATIILLISFSYFPQMTIENLTTFNPGSFFVPIGVVLFALLGFTSLPELREELMGDEKDLKLSIILGSLIPISLYLIFSITFIAVLGKEIEEIATLSFGPSIALVGIFTMSICYFVLSFSLKDIFIYDQKIKRSKRFFIKSIVPLLLFLIVYSIGWNSFSGIIGITGVVSSALIGILCLFMNYNAKKTGKRTPEYSIPINKFILSLLSLVFILGVLFEVYHLFY